MKKFKSSLTAKICAWILLALFALLFSVSVAGVTVLVGSQAYFDGGRNLRKIVANEVFSFDRHRISLYAESVLQGEEDIAQYGYDEIYDPKNSNIFFSVENENGEVIIDHMDNVDWCEKIEYESFYHIINTDGEPKINEMIEYFSTYEEAVRFTTSEDSKMIYDKSIVTTENGYKATIRYYDIGNYTVKAFIRSDFTAKDKYYYTLSAVNILTEMRFAIIFIGLASAVICLVIMIFLCSAAGHKAGSEEIYLSRIHRIPLDLYAAVCISCSIFSISMFFNKIFDGSLTLGLIIVLLLPFCAVLPASVAVTFAARLKKGGWWRNTLIYKFFALIFRVLKYIVVNLPFYWKAIMLICAVKIVEFIFILERNVYPIFWLLESFVLIAVVIYAVVSLRKLQKAASEIAKGDLEYRVDVRGMTHSLRSHGENLNNISNGLKAALDERVKSERMKAELITNVSHDIKTPLTSIVNYIGLLRRDGLASASAPEYLDVLENQAVRLKKLTEDLIEASKASSGCIAVNAENTDVNVLLSQAAAEYDERFSENSLELVMNLSDKAPVIFADGRLMWRVFDNFFNNICKYALKGTRIYIKSDIKDNRCVIVFSNISAAPLNISGEELVERFVRGDASRNTEGSGLGLSIAQSLIELQGGTFKIKIDADLFKAEMTFENVAADKEQS